MAVKRGDVEITIIDTTGKLVNASLKDVLVIPTYTLRTYSQGRVRLKEMLE